jgi:hypothetical protein
MSIQQLKEALHLRIEQADERLLRVIHAVTEAYEVISEEDDLDENQVIALLPKPELRLTMEELISEIQEADAEIERGEFITSEDLEQEIEQW